MGWLHYDNSPLPSRGGLNSLDGQVKIVGWDPVALAELVQVVEVPDGEAGTDATIQIMADLAQKAAKDPAFVLGAQEIIRGANLRPKDFKGELETLFNWVATHIRYTMDPRSLEWVQAPFYTMHVRRAGDCDDEATLLCALAGALGHGWGFRAYRADPARRNEFSHVVARLAYRGPRGAEWLTADVTNLADQRLGWDPNPNRYFSFKDWIIATP